MTWAVEFEDEFEAEFDEWSDLVKVELLARAKVLAQFGPGVGKTACRYVEWLGVREYERAQIQR